MTLRASVLWFGLLPLVLAAGLAAGVSASRDYGGGLVSGDDAAPAISALLHGKLIAAAHAQPLMGLTSILLRLPAVAIAGAAPMLQYRLGVFVCAWVAGLVGAAVAVWARSRGRPAWSALLIAALMVLNPLTLGVQLQGHPEELLGGSLCLAAVLCAIAGRPLVAGLILGLAIGTKEWTLVAAVPVFLACGADRRRMLIAACGVAAPLVLLLPLLDPPAFLHASHAIGRLRFVYFSSWWWPVNVSQSITVHVIDGSATATLHMLPLGLTRADVAWLPVAAAIPIGWCYRRAATDRDPGDALALLALLLLLRCTLDPAFSSYYFVPFLLALLAWESVTRRGLPLVSLLAFAVFWFAERFTGNGPAFACDLALTLGLGLHLARTSLQAKAAPGRALPSLS